MEPRQDSNVGRAHEMANLMGLTATVVAASTPVSDTLDELEASFECDSPGDGGGACVIYGRNG